MALCFMRISIRIKEQITYQFNVGKYFCLFHNNENQNLMDLYLIQFYPSTITTYHLWRFGKIPFSSFLWVETLEIYTVWSNGRNLKFFSGSHNGILLQKLYWPTVRKKYSVIKKNFEVTINSNSVRSEQCFLICSWRWIRTIRIQIGKKYWDLETCRKS